MGGDFAGPVAWNGTSGAGMGPVSIRALILSRRTTRETPGVVL